jgi:glycosyltransferase involved in cell wall biosynthesis
MRKITHVITTIERGGAEKQLMILVRAQVNRGNKIGIVFLKGDPDLQTELEEIGVSFILDLSKSGFLAQIIKLRKKLKSEIQTVHSHLPRAEIVSAISNIFLKNSLVVTRHNSEKFYPQMPKFISSPLSRIITRQSDFCISISKSVEKFIKTANEVSNACPTQVVYYGFHSNQFHKEKAAVSRKDFTVGTISRLVPQKDIPTMLRGFEQFSKKRSASLRIVGDGFLSSELRQMGAGMECAESIEWLGKISNIEKELRTWHLFLLTSKYEGFGMVLLEAMNCQVPIVASRNSAIVEVMGSDYPFLFETSNPNDLLKVMTEAAAFQRSWFTDYYRARLEIFSVEKLIQATEAVYELADK